jgi:non-ribosomal peptide synthetase component F
MSDRNRLDEIKNLSASKRAILLSLLREGAETEEDLASAPRGVSNGPFLLSFAQRDMWAADQLGLGKAVFNILQAVDLRGALNVRALEQVFNEIIRRHETLRTIFVGDEGEPAQVISPEGTLVISYADLKDLEDTNTETRALQIAVEEGRRSFCLARGPLIRGALLRLDGDRHFVLLNMHHIISDAWSMGVLVSEISSLYRAFILGEYSPLTEMRIQYKDYTLWLRRSAQKETLDKQILYWKQKLEGIPSKLELPSNRIRPAKQSFSGAHHSFALSSRLSARIRDLIRRERVTLFVALLAAFKTLLFWYTGQEDLVVGTPVAGRTHPAMEGLIGLFVNMLIMRCDLSGDPGFKDLMQRVKESTIDAYANQDLPFDRLLAELHPDRDMSRTPIAQIGFDLHNGPMPNLEVGGLRMIPLKIESGTAKCDLVLFAWDGPEGIQGLFEYSTDLFDPAAIARMSDQYETLLEGIVAGPEKRLSALLPASRARSLATREAPRNSAVEFEEMCALSNLTVTQLLFYLGQKLQPDEPIYNRSVAFTILGHVDESRFKQAFRELVDASDALRTVIEEIEGIPQQRVLENITLPFQFLDFSQSESPGEEARQWASKRCRVPFDLEKPLLDCALIKLTNEKYIWYLNHHNIIADASSERLIYRHVEHAYQLIESGQSKQRWELPRFSDYVKVEIDARKSARHATLEAYWKRRLTQKLEPISFYGKVPSKQLTQGKRVCYRLSGDQMAALSAFAKGPEISVYAQDVSFFSVFAATLFSYLHHISRSSDLSLGVAYHGRTSKRFEETIGLTMQVLPLRVTIDPNETFRSLIQKVVQAVFESLKHAPCTIRWSVQTKPYHVLLNYVNGSFASFNGAPVEAERFHSGHQDENLALHIHRFDESGNFVVEFDFDSDLFSENESEASARHFARTLEVLIASPDAPIARADLLWVDEEKERFFTMEKEMVFDF